MTTAKTIAERIQTPADLRRLRREYKRAKAALRTFRAKFGTELMLLVAADVAHEAGELRLLGEEAEAFQANIETLRRELG